MSGDPPTGPQEALIRAVSSNLSLLHVFIPSWPGCGMPPLSYWLPGPRPIPTLFPTGPVKVLPWLTGSYISNQFHMRGLLVALMMEAARTSETLVNFYQTTWCYTQKTAIFILTAMRTSNPTQYWIICLPWRWQVSMQMTRLISSLSLLFYSQCFLNLNHLTCCEFFDDATSFLLPYIKITLTEIHNVCNI
jgi:hypothetical protein